MNMTQQLRAPAGAIYTGLIAPWIIARAKDLFLQPLDFTIAAGVTGTLSFQVDSDSDWFMASMNAVVFDVGDLTTPIVAPLMVAITDTGSGRNLQRVPFHIGTAFGNGALPGFVPYPKVIPRASTVQVSIQNQGLITVRAFTTFGGFKIFPMLEPPPPPLAGR